MCTTTNPNQQGQPVFFAPVIVRKSSKIILRSQPWKLFFFLLTAFTTPSFIALSVNAQCTVGCNQSATTNVMPGTNNFANTFCITTGSTLTYNQNFDMNGGTACVGPNVTFNATGGNWNGNWTVNNYGSFSRGITLNSGQVFNNYGTFTGSVSLNGGTIVNYSGATFTPSSFNFNGGSFTNNSGGRATFSSSVTINSGARFSNNGTLTTTGLTLNSSAIATLGGTTTINGSVTNNGTINIAGLVNVTGNYNQNSSGTVASQPGSQCNTLNTTGTIQGQGSYNGSNGLLLTQSLSPSCPSCLVNGTSTSVPGTPVNQITGATLTSSVNNISGTITNPGGSPAATHYIVLRQFGAAIADQPTNYVNYAVGNVIGSSVVVAVNAISILSFTDANAIAASGCGTYYYAVFPYNASGSCGTYNRTINATNRSSIAITGTSGSVGTNATICSGSTSGTLTLTGYTGSIVRWESSVSPFSTWSAISNTSNTYTSGVLTQTTQFRAVVNAGASCSNVNSTAAIITMDNIAPSITCPGSQTINLNTSCSATMPDYTSMATVADNCTPTGSITVAQSPVAGTVLSGAGSQTITLTATDASGNAGSCTFTLAKLDVTAPVISCPANITTNSATGMCGAIVNYSVTASDNCSGGSSCIPSSISSTYTLVGTYGGHTYYRSNFTAPWATAKANAIALGGHLLTLSSAGENNLFNGLGSHWAGFTDEAVEGTWVWVTGEPVVFTNWAPGEPNDYSAAEDHMQLNWNASFNWNDYNGATNYPYIVEFDCVSPTLTMISGLASGSVFPTGTTSVSYTATDAAGNTSAACNFTVTVNDVTAPTIACPANISVNAAAGACDAVVSYNAPVASDNCGSCSTAPVIAGYTALGVYNGSAYYISNAATTCTAAFTAASSTGASIATIGSASENTFVRNAANTAGFTGSYLVGANDAATEGTFVGYSGETLTYTNWNAGEPNNSGNEDYTQVLNNGLWNDIGAATSMNYIIKISCITPVKTSGLVSGSAFPIGVSTINYSATDPSGNTATCSFTVTVSVNPTSLGKTVTAAATQICSNTATTISVASSDNGISYQLRDNATNSNIGSPVTGNGGTINLPTDNLTGTTTFNVYATGSSCSYQLTTTVTVTVNPAATVTAGSAFATCQSATPSAITLTGASVGGSATTGAWSVTSGGGTLSSTAQTATPATVTYTPAASYSGTVVLTLTTNDPAGPCGAVAATKTITVNALPVNKLPAPSATTVCSGSGTNIQIPASEAGVNYQLRNNVGNTLVGAAVAGTGGTINLPTGNLSANTSFNVLATNATTGCTAQMTGTVTVSIDNIAPAITCPAAQTINLYSSCAATLPDYTSLALVSDNCTATGSIVVTQSPAAGTALSGNGIIIITLTATDANGNTSNCTFNLTKLDVTPPVMNCPANITTASTAGICGAIVNYTVTATDNCAGSSSCAPASITGYTLIGTYNGHTYFRSNAATTWAAANTNAIALGAHLVTIGSAGENSFFTGLGAHWTGFTDQASEGTWVWVTGEPVTYTLWNAGEPNNSGGTENYMELNYSGANWNDASGSVAVPSIIEFECLNVNMVSGIASGSVFPIGTTTVTYNATDAAGNTSPNCSFTVTVTDATPPTILCPANIAVAAAAGACDAVVTYNAPVASDNCGTCSTAPSIAGYTALGVYNSNAYYISNATATCTAAFTAASSMGASVATVLSTAENTFIRNAANAAGFTGSYLIGINDVVTEGTFVGFSGETLSYTNWTSGEPNNSGGNEDYTLVYNNGLWNDIGAASVANYVIKVSCITPVRTGGLASGSTFPLGVSTINYTATDPSGNTASCSFTVTVSLNPSSLNKTVTAAAATVCAGTGTNISVALSDNGISYQLRNNATNATIGSPVTGTGGTISLPTGNLAASTTFNVYATGSSCSYQLTNTAAVTVNPAATVTPGTTLSTCQSATPSAITLSGASIGGSATTGAWSVTSGGGTLSSTAQTASPATVTYTPLANYSGSVILTLTTNAPGAPCVAAAATRTISVNPLPTNIAPVAAAASVCNGSAANIQIAASQVGVNYQLRNNTGNVSIGSPVPGTGGTINLPTGNLTANTTFNVLAANASSGCSIQMTSTVTVTINALPADKTPTAVSASVCSGSSTTIQIASSQAGVNYQLRNNTGNVNIGSPVAGTGLAAPITFSTGTLSGATTFNVLATLASTSCNVQMVNTVAVTVNAAGQWIGSTTGDWNTAGNWCGGIPTGSTNVNIPAGTTVTIQSANAVANSVSIAGTGSLVMTGNYNLNITAGGSFINNGTFSATASTGTVVFLGAGTISGTTTFKNIDAYGALDFGTAGTVSGTFSLQTGGSVTGHSPTYICPTSILLYKPGSTFARGLEWTSSASGAGYPANVVIQNNTTVDFPVVGNGYVCNDLTIDNGSSLLQDYGGGSASMRVGRNITIAGTLSLGSAGGGDIYVGGNWTRSTGGVFNANDRKVTFDGPSNFSGNGTSMSSITAPASAAKDNEGGFGGENFAHIWINKTNATDSVVLLSNITVNRELGLTKGTFSLRNSDVTMVSNKTRTADIAAIATVANVTVRYGGSGRFVIQRFIQNPTAVRSWRLLGAPLQSASAPTLNAAYQEGVTNPDRLNPNANGGIYNPWPAYGTHITGPGGAFNATDGFDQGTGSSSILYANTGVSTWTSPASTTGVKVTDKQGWMLFVRGDRGFAIGNQYMPSQSTTLEPKGKIYTGDVAVPVTAARQVIANPYASAISLLNVDVAGTLGKNSTYYMWDPKMFTSYTQPGKWVSFTGTGSSFVQTTSASAYPSNGTIESGQAFVINATAAGNMIFHEADKLSLSSSLVGIANGVSARPAAVIPMFRSDIYANNSGAYTLTDAVLNIFDDTYNNNADAEDAQKVITFNTKESLSILRDSSRLAIEKRRNIQVFDTIFFAMSRFNEIPYRFRFAASNFVPGMEAFLEDKFNNSRTALSMTDTSVIDFAITADPLSKAEDRFMVVFKAPFGNVLPVTFTNLKAWPLNKNIAVEWKVANELNMKEYEVQKSLDGRRFEKMNTSASQGNYAGSHTYNWLDENTAAGNNYYRIAGRSLNGTVQYTEVVKVNMDKKGSISIYPNPVTDGIIRLSFNDMEKGTYNIRLLNTTGQAVLSFSINYSGGSTIREITAGSNLAKGMYNLEVNKTGKEKMLVKVIVE